MFGRLSEELIRLMTDHAVLVDRQGPPHQTTRIGNTWVKWGPFKTRPFLGKRRPTHEVVDSNLFDTDWEIYCPTTTPKS